MKALSVKQPWAWLLVQGIKDIENRVWTTPYRGPVLLLASKEPDPQCFTRQGDLYPWPRFTELPVAMPASVSVYEHGGIVGIADLVDVVKTSASPWHVKGQYGFVFANARAVRFTPYRGQLKLFDVSDALLETLEVVQSKTA